MLSVYAQDHVAFSPCSNYSDSFSYISFPYAFPLHKDYGQDGADDDDDESNEKTMVFNTPNL